MAFKIAICISENCKVPRFVVVPFVSAATVQWVCGTWQQKLYAKPGARKGNVGQLFRFEHVSVYF